jgi:hypothetical protein
MSFSPEWLKLREPADHRARNPVVFAAVLKHITPLSSLNIMDIGCGTGSNLRGMALNLPQTLQNWCLVDYDATLLTAAKAELQAWADWSKQERDMLHLKKGHKDLYIRFIQADLTQDLEHLLALKPDLLTAAAFFDLCAESFIERLAKACAAHKTPLYTILTYDGVEEWLPPHALDIRRLNGFLKHQNTDKGFGAAMGATANLGLLNAFKAQGMHTLTAKSPWHIQQDEAAFLHALAQGAAQAVVETGDLTEQEAQDWVTHHKTAQKVNIGHDDFFAYLP